MPHTALTTIRAEHQALAAVLRSLTLLLAHYRRHAQPPDFGLLRAMLFYIDEFPERLHHRKETELLFPPLRARCPELGAVLDRLDNDHDAGEQAIRTLEHALLAYEVMGESRRDEFETQASRYADFYLQHMSVEEQQVLPAAATRLTEEEWARLDAAFEAHRDPLVARAAGREPDAAYFPLWSRIVLQAPAPIGLGPSV